MLRRGRGRHRRQGVVDPVLSASRALITVATKSLGAAAEEITIAGVRALVVQASDGPQRLGDLVGVLEIAPSTAGRMSDRLVGKGLIPRHGAGRTAGGAGVADSAGRDKQLTTTSARRGTLISEILGSSPAARHQEVAEPCRRSPARPRTYPTAGGLTGMLAPHPAPGMRRDTKRLRRHG